jgi:hypothetical protein
MVSSDGLSGQYARRCQAAHDYRDGVWKTLLHSTVHDA